jgi:hypothetical protein
MVSVETLIRSLVYPNPTNQTYQAHIWVVNPFAVPLLATVTQPLPPGAAVVSTDGLLWNDSIVWTNMVATNGLVEQSFSFTFAVPPGAGTNLPPPTLMFSDGTGTNSLTKAAAAATFLGLLPVGVSCVIPSGTWGVDTVAQLNVTNFTAASQVGSFAISLTDSKGNAVTNFSLSFAVSGLAGTNLTYSLPGTLQIGSYSLVGTLTINGGTAQVVSGTYVVPLPPTMLSLDSTALATTNSFTMVLRGPPGFNFLLEASTNLVDWTPIQYFERTDPAVYCTDSALANSQTRFYRALMADSPS